MKCACFWWYSRTSGSSNPINQSTLLIRPVSLRAFLVNFNVNNLIKMATSLIRLLLDSPKGGLIHKILLHHHNDSGLKFDFSLKHLHLYRQTFAKARRYYCICTNFPVVLIFVYFVQKKIAQKLVPHKNLVELSLLSMVKNNFVNRTIRSRDIAIFLKDHQSTF